MEAAALPAACAKVLEARRLLASGAAKSVAEASRRAGLSRSAYYKYKDSVFTFSEKNKGRTVTLSAVLSDRPGVLSNLLSCFAQCKSNILTINQSIPANGAALVTVSFEASGMSVEVEHLLERLRALEGVIRVTLAGEDCKDCK